MMNYHLMNVAFLRKLGALVTFAGLFVVGSANVSAAPISINLVKNGDFSLAGGNGQIDHNTTVANWNTTGYNFLFAQDTADTVGAMSWFGTALTLWGANNGGANALATSGNGGNFIGADGDYGAAPISQLIDGLVVGKTYEVSFEWAAAQQFGFTGETTEYWRVNLGTDAATWQATSIYQNANHSSSGWMKHSMFFTASNASEWLTFMAVGTPEGEPPFSLLDGVSMREVPGNGAEVPEPASLSMLLAGLGVIALSRRRRARHSA